MSLAIVIIHYGNPKTTEQCLQKLKSKIEDNTLILINNTPHDITPLTKIIPQTHLIDNRQNLGFAKAVNQGITHGLKNPGVKAIFLMNNDLSLTHGGFAQLRLVLSKIPSAGLVTPILHHQGGYDWGGKYNPWTGMVRHKNWDNLPKTIQPAQHVAGAALLITRAVVAKIGLFDERFFLYYEDLDYCLRAKDANFTIHITPFVVAEHAVSASSSSFGRTRQQWLSHFRFVTKHLFKHAYPTAYFYTLVMYPLFLLRSALRK